MTSGHDERVTVFHIGAGCSTAIGIECIDQFLLLELLLLSLKMSRAFLGPSQFPVYPSRRCFAFEELALQVQFRVRELKIEK